MAVRFWVSPDNTVFGVNELCESEYEYALCDGPFKTIGAAKATVCKKILSPCTNCMEMIRNDEQFCPFCGHERKRHD